MRLIDADALLQRIWYGNTDSIVLRSYASELVKAAPTIEAEPAKHGRWIPVHGSAWYKCSACENRVERGAVDFYDMVYCPICGAKMDEEGSDD